MSKEDLDVFSAAYAGIEGIVWIVETCVQRERGYPS